MAPEVAPDAEASRRPPLNKSTTNSASVRPASSHFSPEELPLSNKPPTAGLSIGASTAEPSGAIVAPAAASGDATRAPPTSDWTTTVSPRSSEAPTAAAMTLRSWSSCNVSSALRTTATTCTRRMEPGWLTTCSTRRPTAYSTSRCALPPRAPAVSATLVSSEAPVSRNTSRSRTTTPVACMPAREAAGSTSSVVVRIWSMLSVTSTLASACPGPNCDASTAATLRDRYASVSRLRSRRALLTSRSPLLPSERVRATPWLSTMVTSWVAMPGTAAATRRCTPTTCSGRRACPCRIVSVMDALAFEVACLNRPCSGKARSTRTSRTSDSDWMVRVSSPCSARW
ncbi:hypothetical protein D3C71_1324590 [compost metagenome]